jgi:predicted dehydrogenase
MDILAKGIFSGKLFRGAGMFYKTIISQFINSIESGTDAPISGEEGLAVVAVSEAAKISLAENRFVMINELFA